MEFNKILEKEKNLDYSSGYHVLIGVLNLFPLQHNKRHNKKIYRFFQPVHTAYFSTIKCLIDFFFKGFIVEEKKKHKTFFNESFS